LTDKVFFTAESGDEGERGVCVCVSGDEVGESETRFVAAATSGCDVALGAGR
jgi:hypothetical protein